ncbi:MAG: adenosine kinase [Bacteroidetes bacterium]|nr:adenosine kinase [Bacteroidota bacterium]
MKRILGMGNALVDIIIPVESDTIPEMLALPKGSMQLVDRERSNSILTALKGYKKTQSAGGSAANTIHGLAKLGASAGYIGVIGEDELGGFFVRDLIQAGVEPHMIHSKQETGRAVTLVTPDSERTFATYLGAAIELSAEHLTPPPNPLPKKGGGETPPPNPLPKKGGGEGHPIFSKYHYFHIEGYLVQNHELIRRAVELAKENGLIVSLDMASYNVVEANRDFLHEIIRKYVDILFANEEESLAFTGHRPEQSVHEIAKFVDIAIVKTGSLGSLIKTTAEYCEIGVIPAQPIDTTGAGDLYAAGFLYGHAAGMPLQKCGELGALLAGNVIECMGSKMDDARWNRILLGI